MSAGGLVTLTVGDLGRAGARGRGRVAPGGAARGARQWSCRWTGEGPGEVVEAGDGGRDGEPDLALGLSWDDAGLVAAGQLPPSVAYMQGRLKTSGDNALLLQVLAWSATPAFQHALEQWAKAP